MTVNYADLEFSLLHYEGDTYFVNLKYRIASSTIETDLLNGIPSIIEIDQNELLSLSNNELAYSMMLSSRVFSDENIRKGFLGAETQASSLQIPLRVRLALPHCLHWIKWELLVLPWKKTPLSLDSNIITSRYIMTEDLSVFHQSRPSTLKTLLVACSPSNIGLYNLVRFKAEKEMSKIMKAFQNQQVQVNSLYSGQRAGYLTLQRLKNELAQGYDIVFVVAHGMIRDNQGYLWLEDSVGKATPISAETIAQIVKNLPKKPLLVVLAACGGSGSGLSIFTETSVGIAITQAGVPAVIGMQGLVPIEIAYHFFGDVFAHLQEHGQIDLAVRTARLSVAISEKPYSQDWWKPVLFMRIRDGRVWNDLVNVIEMAILSALPVALHSLEVRTVAKVLNQALKPHFNQDDHRSILDSPGIQNILSALDGKSFLAVDIDIGFHTKQSGSDTDFVITIVDKLRYLKSEFRVRQVPIVALQNSASFLGLSTINTIIQTDQDDG